MQVFYEKSPNLFEVFVENACYSLKLCEVKVSQPLGISEYELQKLYPTKVEGTIPTIAEIESVAQDTVVKPED